MILLASVVEAYIDRFSSALGFVKTQSGERKLLLATCAVLRTHLDQPEIAPMMVREWIGKRGL